jgi:hypothetical protein
MTALLGEVDRLYEDCVMTPARWHEQAFIDWADGVAAGNELDRVSARQVRRILVAARKLAAFWSDRDPVGAPEDWRSRVDVALGSRAWRPELELARHLLDVDGTEEAFATVCRLFPLVHHEPFLDGIGYDEWREGHDQT